MKSYYNTEVHVFSMKKTFSARKKRLSISRKTLSISLVMLGVSMRNTEGFLRNDYPQRSGNECVKKREN